MHLLEDEIVYQIIERLQIAGQLSAEDLATKVAAISPLKNETLLIPDIVTLIADLQQKGWIQVVPTNKVERIQLTQHGINTYYFNKKHREKITREANRRSNPLTLLLNAAPGYEKRFEAFIRQYDLIDLVIPMEAPPQVRKKETERVCRFCGKQYPEVRFTQDTHVISDMLGRNSLYSDFECDSCNVFFGTSYESELANYLGIARTLTQTKGKKKVPTFTAPGNAIRATYQNQQDDSLVVISRQETNNGLIVTEVDRGEIHLTFPRNPFTPLKVYKACLKIALSVLPDADAFSYRRALELLKDQKKWFDKGLVITGYELPFSFRFPPHVYIFQKRVKDAPIYTHIAAIYFANSIMAVPIPLHDDEVVKMHHGQKISVPLYPPIFTQFTNMKDVPIVPFKQDFSSDLMVSDSKQEIVIKIPEEELDKMILYDKETGQYSLSTFSFAEITRLVLSDTNSSFDPSHFFSA